MSDQPLEMNPFRLLKKRPDLWPEFIGILYEENEGLFKMFVNDPIIQDAIKNRGAKLTVLVADLPPRAQKLVLKASAEAMRKLETQNAV